MSTYYTYYSYEEFGRGYIGYRKCPEKYTPETDPYLGSFSDKSFKPTQKVILGIYDNKDDAIADEIVLHTAYDVAKNPIFANKARQTSVGFSMAGTTLSAERRAKLSEAGRGKTHSAEARAKMSQNNSMKRPEVAAKVAEARRGKPLSAEHRAKLSENSAMRKRPEVAAKVAAAKLGNPHSAEARQKMSETKRKNAKRYDWENTLTGEKYENLCIAELCDFHPDLHYSALRGVTIGKHKHHKGWVVVTDE